MREKRRRKLRNAKTSATGQIQKAGNHTTVQVSVKPAGLALAFFLAHRKVHVKSTQLALSRYDARQLAAL